MHTEAWQLPPPAIAVQLGMLARSSSSHPSLLMMQQHTGRTTHHPGWLGWCRALLLLRLPWHLNAAEFVQQPCLMLLPLLDLHANRRE